MRYFVQVSLLALVFSHLKIIPMEKVRCEREGFINREVELANLLAADCFGNIDLTLLNLN